MFNQVGPFNKVDNKVYVVEIIKHENRLHENGTMIVVGAMKGTSNVYKQGITTCKFQIHIVYYCKQKLWLFLCGKGNIRRHPLECNCAFCNTCNLLSFTTSTSHFYNYFFYIFTFGPMYNLKYNNLQLILQGVDCGWIFIPLAQHISH